MTANRSVQDKCHQEISNLLECREEKIVHMTDIKHLPYLQATIQEIQRHANLIPINLEHQTNCAVQIGDHLLPGGTIVIPQVAMP